MSARRRRRDPRRGPLRLRRFRGEGWLGLTLPERPIAIAGSREPVGAPLLAAMEAGEVKLALDGAPVDPRSLPLTDFHLVRDVLERAGALAPAAEAPFHCVNCDAPLAPERPGAPLEPLLDPPEDVLAQERAAPARRTLERPLGAVTALEIRVPTVASAETLWRRQQQEVQGVDERLVRALGLRGIGRRGRWERRPAALARWLERIPEAHFEVVLAAFEDAVYPARLQLPVVCDRCGARDALPSPSCREVAPPPEAWDALLGARGDPSAFPDFESFAALARRLADEVFEARGVRRLVLVVEGETPAVDDAGVPLLGSYLPIPGDENDARDRFEITVYYRTFAAEHAAADFDLEAELRETLDHEVEHHLHHLRGVDPLDAEERREAREELVRVYGATRVRDAERTALARELGAMGRFFLVGLLAAGALLAVAMAAGLVE